MIWKWLSQLNSGRFILLALGSSATAFASPSIGWIITACAAWTLVIWSYWRWVHNNKATYLRESGLTRRDDSWAPKS